MDRTHLGDAMVVSLTRAAQLLPMRTDDAKRWLRREGLVSHLEGRELVVWGRVLSTLADPSYTRAATAAR